VWLNVGDAYAATGKSGGGSQGERWEACGADYTGPRGGKWRPAPAGLKPKDLCGLPWRLALALQAAGWWLRQDLIWAKKAPLPESVRDRCTKSHEYLFLLSKQPTYYFDAEAIKESVGEPTRRNLEFRGVTVYKDHLADKVSNHVARPEGQSTAGEASLAGRNKRSVWHLGPEPYAAAHFACFPTKLVEPCILAGSSAYGVCSACGAPWRRVVERVTHGKQDYSGKYQAQEQNGAGRNILASVRAARANGHPHDNPFPTPRTTGWTPTCQCSAGVQPATILDPFVGSGTVPLVASAHGRASIGIDLSQAYLDLAVRRLTPALAQLPLFAVGRGEATVARDVGDSSGAGA
jgi:hypothetical protein